MHRVDVGGGVGIAYRLAGDPGSPPMLLLHGLTSDGSSWDAVVDAFAERWRVYVPDLRGHGRSDWPGTYSFELLRDDLLGFLRALDLTDVVLVGHSMGGVAAYLLALDHPERLRALVLEETPPPFRQNRPVPERPVGELPYDWDARIGFLRQVNEPDPTWWTRLTELAVPTLVIAGGPESPFLQDQLAAVADRIPGARLLSLPAGHGVHRALPEEFVAAVIGFTEAGTA
ncbi:alpha/beta fold hydrolase [Flindersiella endophytica]